MKLIAKHLPLLALALLVSSTKLRADDWPFMVGDRILVRSNNNKTDSFMVAEIRGKWVRANDFTWYNSDQFYCVEVDHKR